MFNANSRTFTAIPGFTTLCALLILAGSAAADIPTAKLTTRGTPGPHETNRISVKTGDQEEIATTGTVVDSELNRMQTRAAAINNRKITGIDHNGLDGEEINVNPQSLLYTNSNFHVFSGVGRNGEYLAMEYPQLGVQAYVQIFDGMAPQQLSTMLFQQLAAH